jgi:alginate O-acetyltransferase complex protein AlgJ
MGIFNMPQALKTLIPRVYPFIFICAFFGLLLLPLANLTFSPAEIATGFWGRESLINAFTDFRLKLGDRVFPKAVVGKDGWLFFTAEKSVQDYQNAIPFAWGDLVEVQQNLDVLNAQLQSRGITLLVVIAPDKSSIYPDYMPAEIPVINKNSRLDQFVFYMRNYGKTQVLDLRPTLRQARKTRQVYYATDTHWNDYGAFAAYAKIIATLRKTYPDLKAYPLQRFNYVALGPQHLDLAENIGSAALTEEKFELRLTGNTTQEKELPLEDGRHVTLTWNADQRLPRALVYHDSFFFAVIPMLSANFSSVVFVPHYTGGAIWNLDWIDQQKPDVVIIEFAERYIHDLARLVKP